MRKQGKRIFWQVAVFLMAALIVTACTADTGTMQQNPEAEQQGVPQPQESEKKTLHSSDLEMGFERGSRTLKATDPGDFVKAAGKPQLVELFAFW